ncbi:uncharacterized protein PV09_08187 [Verruconis gallopava]|uniref:Methyltransferase domain-containing protein n=1 Tax=Verruconis gallopava TaxID=253628 RepID=A0A0D1YHH2_9PEZI|nr:uncharacterized protein PV09_08187 [Verruconis gallopava]KIW00297.1 hypothetical protein PV09_08187 [Verruconis gallopava]
MSATENSAVPGSSQPRDAPGQSDGAQAAAQSNANADNVIEAEEIHDVDEADTDSALGEDTQSYTTSLKSAATNYIRENGRRYHAPKDSAYFLPNDEEELDRLDLFHHCLLLRQDGKLHFAPIGEDPQRILDLGTGTGIWAIEMGDKYPSAEIIGNDISPVQPTSVPPNVRFEVDDIESDWVYSANFDYIHGRYLTGSIKNWPRLLEQAYRFVKPGGWVEMQDFDMIFYTNGGEFKEGCPADVWGKSVANGIQSLGLEPHPGHQLEDWMKKAGFINVKAHLLPMPLGPWPKDPKLKEVGTFDLLQFLDGLEAISLRVFTYVHKWDPKEVQVFLSQVRKDMLNPKMQIQHDYFIVYGQRPLEQK